MSRKIIDEIDELDEEQARKILSESTERLLEYYSSMPTLSLHYIIHVINMILMQREEKHVTTRFNQLIRGDKGRYV